MGLTILAVLLALAVTAVMGGFAFLSMATTRWDGDLTTATLSVALANEVSGDASCRRAGDGWRCEVYVSDDSGSGVRAGYIVARRDEHCWDATRRGAIESSSRLAAPARQLSGCITALQSADDHSLLN